MSIAIGNNGLMASIQPLQSEPSSKGTLQPIADQSLPPGTRTETSGNTGIVSIPSNGETTRTSPMLGEVGWLDLSGDVAKDIIAAADKPDGSGKKDKKASLTELIDYSDALQKKPKANLSSKEKNHLDFIGQLIAFFDTLKSSEMKQRKEGEFVAVDDAETISSEDINYFAGKDGVISAKEVGAKSVKPDLAKRGFGWNQ